MTYTNLTTAKLTCPCNTLQTSNSYARSGHTGVEIYSESKPSRTPKVFMIPLSFQKLNSFLLKMKSLLLQNNLFYSENN